MIIEDCRIRGREGFFHVLIREGRFARIWRADEVKECAEEVKEYPHEERVEARGNMLMPPFVEPHIHLDFALTAGNPRFNYSGTVAEGISLWQEYQQKNPLNVQEMKERGRKMLRMLAGFGVQFVRTQVDVTGESFVGVQAMLELKEEMKGIIKMQTVAFPQNTILSLRNGKEQMKQAMDLGMDCVGGIPHNEYSREYGNASISFIFDLAEKYDADIDIHCDEADDESSRFLETVAVTAWERQCGARVVAAHTNAMGSYQDAYCSRLFKLLKDSGIHFTSSPLGSIHLLGRTDTYPKRRGLTRIKELSHAGMNIALAQDNVFDPFYPLGSGNPLRVLEMGIHVEQMTGFKDLKNCLDLISVNGAKNMRLEEKEYGIEEGNEANFILLDGKDDYDVLRFMCPVLLSVHRGKVIFMREKGEEIVNF